MVYVILETFITLNWKQAALDVKDEDGYNGKIPNFHKLSVRTEGILRFGFQDPEMIIFLDTR